MLSTSIYRNFSNLKQNLQIVDNVLNSTDYRIVRIDTNVCTSFLLSNSLSSNPNIVNMWYFCLRRAVRYDSLAFHLRSYSVMEASKKRTEKRHVNSGKHERKNVSIQIRFRDRLSHKKPL
jgi:hypothetical protein